MLHDSTRHTAKEKSTDRPESSRTGHDQLSLAVMRNIQYLVRWMTYSSSLFDEISGLLEPVGTLLDQDLSRLAYVRRFRDPHDVRDRDGDRLLIRRIHARSHRPQEKPHGYL